MTGVARIGHEVALSLALLGASLALVYFKSKQAAEKTAHLIRTNKGVVQLIQADLSLPGAGAVVMTQVKKSFKKLHVLINMASCYEHVPVNHLISHDWDQNLTINLRSAYELSLEAAKLMRKSEWGRIINIGDWTSASGRPRYKGLVPYYVAKAGLQGLTEVLALEFAPHILVNMIAPGPIVPPVNASKKEIHAVLRETPLKRWGGREEITKAIRFLIDSNFVTGECVRVDGGRHLY